MHDEKKLIRLAMITLFLSLMIVYMLLYQVKGDKLKSETSIKTTGKVAIIQRSGTISAIVNTEINTGNLITSGNANSGSKVVIPTIKSNSGLKTGTISGTNSNVKLNILSGTDIYYGGSDSVDKLGIKYQYALRDKKDIYYFNLGNPTYDFKSIAKSLGGDTFTLITEQDIFQNKLFGTKVIFINLPENKNKLVLMVVYVKNEVWLIQIGYDIYHKSKDYIKSLFID